MTINKEQKEGLLIKESTRSYLKELVFVTGIICGLISTGYTLILLPKLEREVSRQNKPLKDDLMYLKILNMVKSTPEEIQEANRRWDYYQKNNQ